MKRIGIQQKAQEAELKQGFEMLNVSILAELIGAEKEEIRSFLHAFVEYAAPVKDVIVEAAEQKNWQLVEREVHALKSSSGAIGAMQLSNLCAELEALARECDGRKINDLLLAFINAYARLMTAIDAWNLNCE